MLTAARERPSGPLVRSRKTHAIGSAESDYETLPRSAAWIQRRLLNPLRDLLLPAGLIRRLLAQSASPLVAESLVRPGGWRSMEITYRDDTPVDFIDRLALRRTPMSLASRNRRKFVTATITRLIREFAAEGPVSIVGVGAGPGLHVQNAIVGSGVDPQR